MPRTSSIITLLILLLIYPAAARAEMQSDGQLQVVTTSTIIADLARSVAQEHAQVTSIVKIGTDPHTFQPVPSDLETVVRADVVFIHGVGLDRRITQFITRSQTNALVYTVTAGLEPRSVSPSPEGRSHVARDSHGHGHDHDEGDPHFWFDPNMVLVYVDNIAHALSMADPTNADAYHLNANRYKDDLVQLDRWIRTRIDEIPIEQRKLVTNHDTLGYFADRYGFEVVGSIFSNFSADAQPSARQIAELVQRFEQAGVTTLFTETTLSPRHMNAVARELGRDVHVVQLYTDSLSEADGPAPTYLDFMRYNVNQIVQALKADSGDL